MVTPLQEYLFDLNGFIKLEKALTKVEVADLNMGLDVLPKLDIDEWYGYLHREVTDDATRGLIYQQIYEAGKPFEKLIDHPSWISKIKHFVGGENTFDYNHGDLFIDENFVSIREKGEAIGLHSGGHTGTQRTQFRYRDGSFHCGQINLLIALTDIGDNDGATMVIPGSHKSNIIHPHLKNNLIGTGASVDAVEGAIEVHMNAGDAILFVDAISHGSAKRTNEGERRILVFRYGPSWGNFRFGYRPSPELLDRLTERQKQIVYPFKEYERTPNRLDESKCVGRRRSMAQ
ncbi:MAG: hypothetical protein COA79_03315 [Planctomycetota bacterium]|nr:MAG: hypothetical protein COA79_03315 [Planctomycetota bacterium]